MSAVDREPFAGFQDIVVQWRPLTGEELGRVEYLLPTASDFLRQEAKKVGKDLDEMIAKGEVLPSVVTAITVDIVARVLAQPTDEAPMTQYSQSALGYTTTGTYLVPGGGIFIKKSELARLGLRRQRIGVIELAGNND